MKQIFTPQIKVFSIILAMATMLFLGLWWYDVRKFYTRGKARDLIEIGSTQVDLRSRIGGLTAIELTESEVITRAWADGARDIRYWIEVSFAPKKSGEIREMLLREGYEIPKEERGSNGFIVRGIPRPPEAPKKISNWWIPAKLEKTTIFRRELNRSYTLCFLNEEEGILFIYSFRT